MEEYFFDCPYCWETISILIDVSIINQIYIEDCEVCCNPIGINATCINNQIDTIIIRSIEQ